MRLELFIGKRYFFTKRKEKFLSLISIISVLGVAVGVSALIVVIAVMSGFHYDLRNKILSNLSDMIITHPKNIENYPQLIKKIETLKEIKAISPQVQGQVFILKEDKFIPLLLKGIDTKQEKNVSHIKDFIIKGSFENLDASGIILGKELALNLAVDLGDEVSVFGPLGKEYIFKVKGIFYSGMYDYDLNLIYVNLEKAQEIFDLGKDSVSQLAIRLDNLYSALKVKNKIEELIGFDYNVRTWQEINRNFFSALKLEKITMFIILTLIILVAAFNIISTLVVTVVEKTKDIGILMAVGLNRKAIRRIFTLNGMLIGLTGVGIGTFVGVVLCLLLKKYQFIKLPQDIYYIEYLPVRLVLWPDVILIVGVAILITLFSTIYPALKASQLKPAEALRYE
jgi:lipoprotein-releasing system permease protein